MKQIFAGVDYLHNQLRIAHRDLSLENVLLQTGECKISDFGLSVGVSARCVDQAGKDYYLAPEVVAGVEYDPVKADIWSLGIMWFILLTGSPLVSLASQQYEVFVALAQCGVTAVFSSWGFDEKLSAAVVDLIARMLKIDPADRISLINILMHPEQNHNT
ncbi:unnamed protein product [Phytophthora lilii]|uniref:Unnamed protein product n=1 Tax=Phytophthora lilii TaxID=2077276 RepID=A0A9W6TAG1_9STRA|nr:unnamed protein product [Phytophthora lilii]